MSHRSVRGYRVVEGFLLVAILAAGHRSCVLEREGDPDRAFVPVALTIILSIVLIGVAVGDGLSRSGRVPSSAPPTHDGIGFAEGAAVVSAIAGALAWLPFMPFVPPLISAGAAAVSGLVAWRELRAVGGHTRERLLATLGIAAGVVNLALRAALGLRS
jgi:hypothetical protein